ncbi:NAD-dependent succinate-semialdehyde dehydrogenase [Cupriavidus sp. 30B13]|uniref:NAD-dependent succinate-semialdehyde dehydrogenase n=1 Tax=Cupriavidus sp. 30B13 TaxID=3384241 RepID=UPI003B90B241
MTNQYSYPDTRLLIDGAWVDGSSGERLDVTDPGTGLRIGTVAKATRDDLDRALQAALRGFRAWRAHTPFERSQLMRRAAAILRERSETIAPVLTLEQGKPLAEALIEVRAAADIIEWFAEEGTRVQGRILPQRRAQALTEVFREPVGPVTAFTPWNFPITQVVRKASAALASGCSMIVKAPEETPAAPAALMQAFLDAGLPPGVLQMVCGDPADISEHLIASPVIRKITFTGSTAVGKRLAALAGAHMKRCTMELGGHAPVIVARDADVALAASITAAAKFRNAGQVCISPTRFLVHRDVAAAFAEAFVAHGESLVVGHGLAAGTSLGPLANPRRLAAMEALVGNATQAGARLACGGSRLAGEGNFFAPTVLLDVPQHAAVFNEEPFGPLAAMRSFDTLEEAIAEANRLPFGLSAYAFTDSARAVRALSTGLEAGMLWVNQAATPTAEIPFGGVKDSGYGSEGGAEALEAYLNTKSVTVTTAA